MFLSQKAPNLEPFSFIYTTCPNKEAARQLARQMVKEKLATCVNILDNVHSVYMNDSLCEESEVGMLIKTTNQTRDSAIDFLSQEHPYQTPTILTWQAECNESFGVWMRKNTHHGVN